MEKNLGSAVVGSVHVGMFFIVYRPQGMEIKSGARAYGVGACPCIWARSLNPQP